MSHDRMKKIKDCLLCCIEAQMNNLEETDTAELGEAIDMLKDLEEAIYYNTVTKAMTEDSDDKLYWGEKHNVEHYYSTPMEDGEGEMMRSPHEGKSHMNRKMYMEAKTMHQDKAVQLRELEKYMQELTNDMIEMIQDASPEEKSYLEKKITTLAAKIGQMK